MSTAQWTSVGIALLSLAACVRSTEPMGLEPATLSPADWDGLWLFKGGVAALTVTDSIAGELRLAPVGEDLPEETEALDVLVRRSGDWLFMNTRQEGSDSWDWVRIKMDEGQLIAWSPDASAFRSLVSAGDLPGEVRPPPPGSRWPSGTVILEPLTPAQYERMQDGSLGVLLDWESPDAMIRFQPFN